jgi:hypothetical protein
LIETQIMEMILRYGFACMVTAWLLYERYKLSVSQVESLAQITTNLDIIADRLERL